MDETIEILVLDSELNSIGIIDNYISFIWTDRYYEYGDFELYFGNVQEMLQLLKRDYFLWIKYSNHLMIIEDFKIETDIENGDKLTVTGRSVESLLDRRIIWTQTILRGNLQDAIHTLLNDAIISPENSYRRIDNFVFAESTDSYISSLTISCQFTGTNLYEAIHDICESYGLGFAITLDNNNNFVFYLYNGYDRSYLQAENPYVVFSKDFDNILNSEYQEINSNFRNCAHIGGEGEGLSRVYANIEDNSYYGIYRREIFVDARDISSDVEEGQEPMTEEEYKSLLVERGYEKMSEYVVQQHFNAKMDTTNSSFVFNSDYFVGDIVEVVNEYNIKASCRILEMIINKDESGFKMYPTFSSDMEMENSVYYYVTETPTLLNYPAWNFVYNIPCNNTVRLRNDLKFNYSDVYYELNNRVIAYNINDGISYRFVKINDEWTWIQV